MKITVKQIKKKLYEVLDPELNISIIDLGLIYGVKLSKDNQVYITMTLTTIGCPLLTLIEDQIKNKVSELGIGQSKINIKIVFNPPWTMDKMTKKGKKLLGIS